MCTTKCQEHMISISRCWEPNRLIASQSTTSLNGGLWYIATRHITQFSLFLMCLFMTNLMTFLDLGDLLDQSISELRVRFSDPGKQGSQHSAINSGSKFGSLATIDASLGTELLLEILLLTMASHFFSLVLSMVITFLATDNSLVHHEATMKPGIYWISCTTLLNKELVDWWNPKFTSFHLEDILGHFVGGNMIRLMWRLWGSTTLYAP